MSPPIKISQSTRQIFRLFPLLVKYYLSDCRVDLFLTSWSVITACVDRSILGAGSRMTGAIQGHDYVCKYAGEFLLTGIMRRSTTEPRELPTWRDRLSETWANNWVMHVACAGNAARISVARKFLRLRQVHAYRRARGFLPSRARKREPDPRELGRSRIFCQLNFSFARLIVKSATNHVVWNDVIASLMLNSFY